MPRRINRFNQAKALQILVDAFRENPNIRWMTGGEDRRLKYLCQYCLKVAKLFDGAYLSDKEEGVLLFVPHGKQISLKQKIQLLWYKIGLIWKGLRWQRVCAIVWIDKFLHQLRPQKPHFYCIMLAAQRGRQTLPALLSLKRLLYQKSESLGWPIYLQATSKAVMRAYQYIGFNTYGHMPHPFGGFEVFFMKREIPTT